MRADVYECACWCILLTPSERALTRNCQLSPKRCANCTHTYFSTHTQSRRYGISYAHIRCAPITEHAHISTHTHIHQHAHVSTLTQNSVDKYCWCGDLECQPLDTSTFVGCVSIGTTTFFGQLCTGFFCANARIQRKFFLLKYWLGLR